MTGSWLQSLRRILGWRAATGAQALVPARTSTPSSSSRPIDLDFSVFREGDRVLIHGKNPILSKPLTLGQRTDVRRGVLQHNDIIGRNVRDMVQAHKGPRYRLSFPTLEEYVVYTPRLVTPIYAADASLIVSLLDIHPPPAPASSHATSPTAQRDLSRLEILEAGTGHGSLTLHLARAIQAANTPPPPIPKRSQIRILETTRGRRPDEKQNDKIEIVELSGHKSEHDSKLEEGDSAESTLQANWDTWRAQRQALIHTVDVSPKFSAHAEKIVRGFRRGLYAGNVDFHVGHVEDWIAEQIRERSSSSSSLTPTMSSTTTSITKIEPFLSYAILDMPSANQRIAHVAPILRPNGLLAVFMPSITQIGECVQIIRQQMLPFVLERAVELGTGLSSGRLWDVRMAMKKSRADPSSWVSESETESEASPPSEKRDRGKGVEEVEMDEYSPSSSSTVSSTTSSEEAEKTRLHTQTQAGSESEAEDNAVLVCRPKVGLKIVGGGFVGIWRRIGDNGPDP